MNVILILCDTLRREQLVQLVDIYPTVLEAMGRPAPRPNRPSAWA